MATAPSATTDFAGYHAALQRALLSTTRAASGVLAPADLKYQRTLERQLGKKIDATSKRYLGLTARLIAALRNSTEAAEDHGKGKKRQLAEDDVVDGYERNVVQVTDGVFEKIDTYLDEHKRNASKKNEGVADATVQADSIGLASTSDAPLPVASTSYGRLPAEITNASKLAKPQLLFNETPDNSRTAKWTPSLPSKPHGLDPLNITPISHTDVKTGVQSMRIPNPYAREIDEALKRPLPEIADVPSGYEGEEGRIDAQKMKNAMSTKPFTYVDNLDLLQECLGKLRQHKVIAVDLEHHDYRSYRGITCLIQVSTVADDFVIDPLVPSVRSNLHILNEVFASPEIVKVLHGSDFDIIWLQRDFGLYIVNLFDTFHASRLLGRSTRHSLASLLAEYTDFVPDKRYQMADWRIRPLPAAMLQYARSDTHFLIYIYQRMLEHPSMPAVLDEVRKLSARTAKTVYEPAGYDAEGGTGPGGWFNIAEKAGKFASWGIDSAVSMNRPPTFWEIKGAISFSVFRALHEWRDRMARELDESARYIFSNRALLSLSENAPSDVNGLSTAMGNEWRGFARDRSHDILKVIRLARQSAEKELADRGAAAQTDTASANSSLWEKLSRPQPGPDGATSNSFLSHIPPRTSKRAKEETGLRRDDVGRHLASAASTLFQPMTGTASAKKSGFASVLSKIHSDLLVEVSGSSPGEIAFRYGKAKPKLEHSPRAGTPSSAEEPVETSAFQDDENKATVKDEYDEDEGIVEVSSRRKDKNKKRKHTETAPPAKVEPFDYLKVKSVLDTRVKDDVGATSLKKQKRDKTGRLELVDPIKAGPKSLSQPKSGNRSHTFL